MNYNQILKKGENFLKKKKFKNPYLDVELILSKVVNRKREEIILNTNNKLKNTDIMKFKNYLVRRNKNEPIAYILGYKHFWKHKFLTNKSVLIPRPDTELVIEEALKYLPIDKKKKNFRCWNWFRLYCSFFNKRKAKMYSYSYRYIYKSLKCCKN